MRFVCISALVLVSLYNPPPTPRKLAGQYQEKTHTAQQQPATNQRGTQDSPVFVKIIPNPKTQEETANDAQDYKDKSTNEVNLVKFTGRLFWATFFLAVIGVFQLFVFGLQAHRLKQTIEAARMENRPWVLLARETTVPVDPPYRWDFAAVVKNYGKTPAAITSLHIEQSLGNSDQNPPATSVFDRVRTFDPFVIPPHEPIEQVMKLPEPWAKDDVIAEKRFLWLCGLIQYSEATATNKVPYQTSFCLVYRVAKGINKAAWQRGPREYNSIK
jgi:hypothetical protein